MEYYENPSRGRGGHDAHYRPTRWPPGVKAIIIANVAIFFVELLVLNASGRNYDTFMERIGLFALSPKRVFTRGTVWQLVTYAFLHDPGSIMHILFNMLFLYWFGRSIELVWGTKRFLIFYFAAAAFSGLAFCLWHVFDPVSSCIGASGAVMAALMVFALWYPNQIILFFFIIPMRIRTFVVFVILIEIFSLLGQRNGVANMAHLGGLLFGYLVIRAGPGIACRVSSAIRKSADRVTAEEEKRLDDLLDKVHREGINSLSRGERRFLKRMSEKG